MEQVTIASKGQGPCSGYFSGQTNTAKITAVNEPDPKRGNNTILLRLTERSRPRSPEETSDEKPNDGDLSNTPSH